jgi:hypothetical protein
MRNKKGAMGIGLIVLLIVGIAVVGGLGFMAFKPGTDGGDSSAVPSERCADSTGILTVNSYSAESAGTDPSAVTTQCGVDGGVIKTSVTSGTTTFPVGAEVACLIGADDYINKSFTFTMPCGGKTLDAPLYYSTSDNPSLKIKNDDDDTVTNDVGGGATNQTDLTAGETLVLEVEFQGTNGESSGDGIYVIEFPASSNANITSVTMAGLESVSLPQVHTLQNAASEFAAFKVPAIVGSEKKTYALSIALTSSKDLSGGVYTDWYGIQEFVDDDDTLGEGVEDSDGTAKYENTLDYDFFINAA